MSETTNQTGTESLKSVPLTPSGMHLLAMLMEAFESTLKAMVDKRVNEVLANMATAQLMDSKLEERITEIVQFRIDEHTSDEPHHNVNDALEDALEGLDLSGQVEKALKYEVNWEDMVDERVREQVEELVPSDDELHDKIREVLNDVTFTVTGTVNAE